MRCAVRDGRFVEPCAALSRQCSLGIRGGLEHVRLYSHGEPTRSFVTLGGVRMRDIKPSAINACPFCGERIDAPVHYDPGKVEQAPNL